MCVLLRVVVWEWLWFSGLVVFLVWLMLNCLVLFSCWSLLVWLLFVVISCL